MSGVVMITKHRQWRAWQFGRRHSGMLSGGGGSSMFDGNGGEDFWNWVETWPRWVKVVVVLAIAGGVTAAMVLGGPLFLLMIMIYAMVGMVVLLGVVYVLACLAAAVRTVIDWMK